FAEATGYEHPGPRVPGGPAEGVRGGCGGRHWLRLQRRAAGHHRPSLLFGIRPRRLPHHDSVQPAVLQRGVLRRLARNRARDVRTGTARGALRHSSWGGVFLWHSRIAVATVGESGWARAAVLGTLLSATAADLSRGAGRRVGRGVLLRDQRCAPVTD